MSALKGVDSIKSLKAGLRSLPLSLAHDVAQQTAPAFTSLTRQAYAGGRSVYGEPRPAGVDGRPLTLHRSGAAQRALAFTAYGTQIRSNLGPQYVRYLIGRYGVLPNGPIPEGWTRAVGEIAAALPVKL